MSIRKLNRISLTEAQASSLASSLYESIDPVTVSAAVQTEGSKLDAAPAQISNAVSEEAHPTDDQLIQYCMQDLAATVRQQVDAHIEVCENCSNEIRRLIELAGLWNEEYQIRRFENRVRSLINPNTALNTVADSISNLMGSAWISLRALVLPKAAYAEGQDTHSEPVEFHITEEGWIVEGL